MNSIFYVGIPEFRKANRYRTEAMKMLSEECERRTGKKTSRLYDEVLEGISLLEQREPERQAKLWESVHGGRVSECVDALIKYGKDNA